jgi:hypothetical protein
MLSMFVAFEIIGIVVAMNIHIHPKVSLVE